MQKMYTFDVVKYFTNNQLNVLLPLPPFPTTAIFIYTIDNLVPVSYLNKNNGKREIRIDTNSFTTDLPFLLNTQNQINDINEQNTGQTIDYISIIGLLVKEIQDLKQTISKLKLE